MPVLWQCFILRLWLLADSKQEILVKTKQNFFNSPGKRYLNLRWAGIPMCLLKVLASGVDECLLPPQAHSKNRSSAVSALLMCCFFLALLNREDLDFFRLFSCVNRAYEISLSVFSLSISHSMVCNDFWIHCSVLIESEMKVEIPK